MRSTSFSHDVLLYRGPGDLTRQAEPLVASARASGAAVLAAVPRCHADNVAILLGADTSDSVCETDGIARNPARLLELVDDALDSAQRSERPLVVLAEVVWPERTSAELDECWVHEVLVDAAYSRHDELRLVCAYDADALDPTTLDHACTHHSMVYRDGAPISNAGYRPQPVDRVLVHPLAPVPPGARRIRIGLEDLPDLRDDVRALARSYGVSERRIDDLVLATNELASNTVQHGGGDGQVEIWVRDGSIWCEVVDSGHLDDPFVGRRRPKSTDIGGRGVWIAHQVCDLVQVRSGPDGTRVRIRMAIT
jgi:anti-sigma regulatory factor (Ser/Thr protein kinase)